METFEEAIEKYRELLRSQNLSDFPTFFQPGDVIRIGRRIYVKSFSTDSKMGKAIYDKALLSEFGISLHGIAKYKNSILTHIYVPKSFEDADNCWLATKQLKLGVDSNITDATVIQSPIYWRWIQLRAKFFPVVERYE